MAQADQVSATESTAGQRGLPHLAGLDGIRGLAALAVVLFHAGVSWLPAGFLGVDVFFVVSGFLITALLVAERERSDQTNLGQFWLRRARRLLPVLVLVLIVTTVYAALVLQDTLGQHLHDVLMAAIYATNWDLIVRGVSYFEMFERPSQLRHLWSLAVEEQFYIVWPILFTLVLRFLNLRWLWCIVAALAVLSVIWMIMLFTPGSDPSRVYFGSDPRAFTILIGVAVGLIWKPWQYTWGRPVGVVMDLFALLGLVTVVAIMIIGRHWSDWMYPWGLLLTSISTIALVAFVIRPGSLIGRALELSPLKWMGERSYSIYLWHWPVMLALQWEFNFVPNTVAMVLTGLIATFILSEISYRLVETPMRRPDFWNPGRYRGAFANPRGLATVTAAISLAVLLALLVGFTVLPGRSPSDLLFSASAEQSGHNQESISGTVPPRPERSLLQTTTVTTTPSTATGTRSVATASEKTIPGAEDNAKQPEQEVHTNATATTTVEGVEDQPTEPAVRLARATPLVEYPLGEYFTTYTVNSGDSPNGIMSRFEMTASQMIDLNGDEVLRIIHPGDELKVPCPGTAPCAFLNIKKIGNGCVTWPDEGVINRLCRSSLVLVDFPIRFTAEPAGPLDASPKWYWDGAATEGMIFTIAPSLPDLAHTAASTLELSFGLPPLAIGDSVMVGARSRLQDVGIEVDAEVGRLANRAIEILVEQTKRYGPRDTVIFHGVGTGFLDAKGFRKLIDAAEGVRHLIVLTRQFPPREPLLSYERDTNKMLREEAAKYDWVTLVDWNEITDGREDEVTWDGTHLNALGRQLYTDHVLAAILSRPPPQFGGLGGG